MKPSGKLLRQFTGKDRGALHGDALGEDQGVAGLRAIRAHQGIGRHLAEHRADGNGPVDAVGDLGVSSNDADTELATGGAHLFEDGLDDGSVGFALREEQRHDEPAGLRAQAGDIVRVNVDHVPADLVRGECDRVRLGHEVPVAEVDDCGISAQPRAEDDPRIGGRQCMVEEADQVHLR